MTSRTIDRRIRLAEAAQRYYVDGWSQDQVADLLQTSRSNVSRLLDAARREGVVRFIIDHPLKRHHALETSLADRFGVKQAIVVAEPDPTLNLVGRAAAALVLDSIVNGSTIAVGWGRTVEATIDSIETDEPHDVDVVQVGGDLTMAPSASGHELVKRLADRLGGRHRFLHAPAVVASEPVANELLSDPHIESGLLMAAQAAIGLVGIGLPGVGFAEKAVSDSYTGDRTASAVVCARLIDASGEELPGPMQRRVIAIDLDDLRAIPKVIGVAAGREKGPAIAATLRGGLLDTLVCDQSAAAAALETGASHDPS